MSKLEFFVVVSLGYLVFYILFVRFGFLAGIPIQSFSLPVSWVLYTAAFTGYCACSNLAKKTNATKGIAVLMFVVFSGMLAILSAGLSATYDTSWDGQGYHQTAVIALANGWNPLREPAIHLAQQLPSQIFAEGYPSALWEIEAGIYALTDKINSAKVVNVMIGTVAAALLYSLLRKLALKHLLAAILALAIVLQPVYVLQLLTFMQDGFGYQLIIIAISSLVIVIREKKAYWALGVFGIAELLLVSTKYSHLPLSLVIGIVFFLVVANRFLNHEYRLHGTLKKAGLGLILISIVFAALPYGRNALVYGEPFYPTNIPDLMGAVKYNNIPQNLSNSDKFSLLFYGIFSRAQERESGDPRHEKNIAVLKWPFTFSKEEIQDAAALYNNRVGAGGPLFSGIIVLSFAILLAVSCMADTMQKRYTLYTTFFAVFFLVFLSLLTPTPNLLRYVNHLQLLPFAIIIPILAVFKQKTVRLACLSVLIFSIANSGIYAHAVIRQTGSDMRQIRTQFNHMKNSGHTYEVHAQHFYSNYVLLLEENIPFVAVESLRCQDIHQLFASSTTTQYCIR